MGIPRSKRLLLGRSRPGEVVGKMLSEKEIWRPHWLIVKRCISGMDVLTVDLCGSAEALVVFRFEEETQIFLDFRLGPSGATLRRSYSDASSV